MSFDLKKSRLYAFNKAYPILSDREPDMMAMINVGQYIEEEFPRKPEDGDSLRIFIGYTNHRGISKTFVMRHDGNPQESPIDIDDMIENGPFDVPETSDPNTIDPVVEIRVRVMVLLQFCLGQVLGIDNDHGDVPPLINWFIGALLTTLYDDPLDVFISVRHKRPEDKLPEIMAMWSVRIKH